MRASPLLVSTDEMLSVVRQWAASHHPNEHAKRLRIDFESGERVVLLTSAPAAVGVGIADTLDPEPTDLHDAILDLLGEAVEPMKASAIARRLQRKYNGHFRNVMKAMRDDGEVTQDASGLYSIAI